MASKARIEASLALRFGSEQAAGTNKDHDGGGGGWSSVCVLIGKLAFDGPRAAAGIDKLRLAVVDQLRGGLARNVLIVIAAADGSAAAADRARSAAELLVAFGVPARQVVAAQALAFAPGTGRAGKAGGRQRATARDR